ncbi:DNA polymerase III catalytic subunit, DnaE type [Pseudobutyrivibrio sp. 49]|uniref:DNA polymerase III subunit alpha n=1 Tax=Pseudobutyrivibrio sp. 49 TaxID=1855344 RepID=UPI00088EDE43|nr:DNA polymerase III subunit alpha [Pseudobutyrivibrio sp. 49]SDI04718.1 DNA polymerase III catalytic subunit, DnaE type [Pseudobutyrivibrio sp. 49]
MSFVHLHTHTEYSLLDGSNKIKSYVAKCKASGMTAAAITDHGNMYGVTKFYDECMAQGVKPIIGCEVYVAPGSRFDREMVKGDDRYYHLILLAENKVGYHNLIKIVSAGYVDGFYYKPRVDFEILEKYHEGLICLSACLAGEVARALAREQYEEAKEIVLKYRDLFGENNYFLEMQDHGIDLQKNVNQGLMRLSRETGIPLVCTNDCHYTNKEDAYSHDVLLCIQTGAKMDDEDRMRFETEEFYVKTEQEMLNLFPYAKEAVYRTQEIADRCNVEIEYHVAGLPPFAVPEGYDAWTYLNKLCFDGLKERYGDDAHLYEERLTYELNTIREMGYIEYFLIVWDFINYARTHDIPVGPGRGSAAGSLISYTTGITDIDPMKYNLVFERFLNPERVSMPDIDTDFDPEGREEVIDYVRKKYGDDCVTQIVTFGTLKPKSVVQDVGRVMGLPIPYTNSIKKLIPDVLPDGKKVTIENAIKYSPDLRAMYEADDEIRKLLDICKSLEGLPRNTGVHAAGVVISGKPTDEYMPLALGKGDVIITQYEKEVIEEIGLLKMDFLGLRNLTVINDTLKQVEKNYGIKLDLHDIDYNDKGAMELFAAGKTDGVFQFESAGMKSLLKQLNPTQIGDLILANAVYRPGPMDFIPNIIDCKNTGKESPFIQRFPLLKDVLADTYGFPVYQEQVMQIMTTCAGYTMGRADNVRRMMSKKKRDKLAEERPTFVQGCFDKNGISAEEADWLFDQLMPFAEYGFNKSHAAAYSYVAVQTAYLKKYYPLEFMAALMTSVLNSSTKIAEYIAVCRESGIELLPPDVNYGEADFAVDNGKIRYGLSAIKSVGSSTIAAIIEDRKVNGLYRDLEDFIKRVVKYDANKRTVENLIKAGALDSLEGNRRQKVCIYEVIMDSVNKDRKNTIDGQMSLFDFADEEQKESLRISLPDLDEFPREILLSFEKELMGIYVSGHPLDEFLPLLAKNVTAHASEFNTAGDEGEEVAFGDDESSSASIKDGAEVIIGGIIMEAALKYSAKGNAYGNIILEDLSGSVKVLAFAKTYDRVRSLLVEGNKVFIKGRVQNDGEREAILICEDVKSFDDCKREVWIQFADKAEYEASEATLADSIRSMDGNDSIVIYLKAEKAKKVMPPSWSLSATEDNIKVLSVKFGADNVRVVDKKLEFVGAQRKNYK